MDLTKKIRLLILLLLSSPLLAQTTTTFTGTVKDLAQATVTSGKLVFTLKAASDVTISGVARFTSGQPVTCKITATGIKANDGVSACVVTMNTAMPTPGTFYQFDICPYNACTSRVNTFAITSTQDISTVVSTPATVPMSSVVDSFSNQTIAGNKTFSGTSTFSGTETHQAAETQAGVMSMTGGATTSKPNNLILVDGVTYSGPQAVQSALQACASYTSGCIVDATNPSIGTQTFTVNSFPNVPIELRTGEYTIQINTNAQSLMLYSHFHWTAYGTKFIDTAPYVTSNSGGLGLVNSQVFYPSGSISNGSTTLTLSSGTGAEVGSLAAVIGAAGAETKQYTTINQGGGIAAGDTSFVATSVQSGVVGWSLNATNYLKIDSEYLVCTGSTVTSFSSCTRGLYGTSAASHLNGATIYAVPYFVSRIATVVGNVLTLEDAATATVTNSPVVIGVQDLRFDGTLTVDGQTNNVTNRALEGIDFQFATRSYVGPQVKVQNIEEHAIVVSTSWDNYISGSFENVGQIIPAGCDVFLFEGAMYNTVRTTSHKHGTNAICIDDRTNTYTSQSLPSNFNSVILGAFPDTVSTYGPNGGQPAVDIEGGSSYNDIYAPAIKTKPAGFGIGIVSAQWTANPVPHGNRVTFGYVDATGGNSLYEAGYTPSVPTNFIGGGTVRGGVSLNATEPSYYIEPVAGRLVQNLGTGNPFSYNFTRSLGITGYPDISGDGTHALVIGDTNGERFDGPILTNSNCKVNTLSPAACGSSAAGSFVVPTTTTTYTVNTTRVTATSQILLHPRTDNSSLPSAPTCVAPATGYVGESARVAATSFTITLPSTTGTSCFDYTIIN